MKLNVDVTNLIFGGIRTPYHTASGQSKDLHFGLNDDALPLKPSSKLMGLLGPNYNELTLGPSYSPMPKSKPII